MDIHGSNTAIDDADRVGRSSASRLVRRAMLAVAAVTAVTVAVVSPQAAAAPDAQAAGTKKAMPVCDVPYLIVAGDSWFGIAKKVGSTLTAVLNANGAAASTALYPGRTVCLPAGVPNSTVPPTTVPAPAPSDTTAPGTTVPAPPAPPALVSIAVFPVQGPCWYSDSWGAPRSGGRKHEGVDVIARSGQYLYAVTDGVLNRQVFDRPGSLSGNAWWLTAANGDYFFYGHLSAFAPGLQVGSTVVAGQIIGWVGATGEASGPHLHFEIHPAGGRAINPTPSVRAVDACKASAPLPQPSGTLPTPPAPGTTVPAPAPGTTVPAPAPGTTVPSPAPAAVPPTGLPGALWSFIAPKTAYDSAWSTTPLPATSRQKIRVDQLAGVPVGTAGVLVRVIARSAGLPGYLTTYPCDQSAPAVSVLSFDAGETTAGNSMVGVVKGSICLSLSTAAFVKVEVLAAQTATGVGVQPVSARRVADTRISGRLAAGSPLTLTPDMLGITSGTQALTATVTVVGPAAAGVLSWGFCGQGPWKVPFDGDAVTSMSMTMRTGSAGWCLSSSVDADLIVDITGQWAGGSSPQPIDPVRLFDSRSTGVQVGIDPVAIQVAGQPGIPAGATTAMLSVTAVTGRQGTSVFVVPCGQPRSSGVASAQSAYRVTTAVVPVSLTNGTVCVSSIQSSDVIVDIVGAS